LESPLAAPEPILSVALLPLPHAHGLPQAGAWLTVGRRQVPKRRSPRAHGWPQAKS